MIDLGESEKITAVLKLLLIFFTLQSIINLFRVAVLCFNHNLKKGKSFEYKIWRGLKHISNNFVLELVIDVRF